MDQDINTLKQNAYTATSQASQMASSAPSLLTSLKQNLVGIFAKDNPLMQARETALADYLSTPQRARADLLPTNMPQVEGRSLALSPTQQDAVTSSRSAAAFAPLAGLNEIIKAQYGNIGEMVQGAGQMYTAQTNAAQNAATNYMNLYKTAIDEMQARKPAAGSGGGIDIGAILKAIQGNKQTGQQSLDEIFATQAAPKKETPKAAPKSKSVGDMWTGALNWLQGLGQPKQFALSDGSVYNPKTLQFEKPFDPVKSGALNNVDFGSLLNKTGTSGYGYGY